MRILVSRILVPIFVLSLLPAPGNAQGTTAKPPTSARSTSQRPDGGNWPRGFSTSEAQVLLFQPQVATWEKQKHLVAFAAVSYVSKGEPKPTMGTIKIEADTVQFGSVNG